MRLQLAFQFVSIFETRNRYCEADVHSKASSLRPVQFAPRARAPQVKGATWVFMSRV